MANKVNVSTTTNTVTITPQQNTSVSIGSTSTPITVTQGSTSVVQVVSQGPQGTTGLTGPTGELTNYTNLSVTGSLYVSGTLGGNITASNISASGIIYSYILDGGANLTLTSDGYTKLEGNGSNGGIILSDGNISRLTFDVGGTPGLTVAGNFFIAPTAGNVIISGSNIEVQGNVSASGNVYGDKIYVLNTGEGSGLEFTGANNRIYYDNPNITTQIDDSDILQVKPTGIQVLGQITTSNITASGNISGSGTGSLGYLMLPNIPTSDPSVVGAVWRDGTDLKVSEG